MLIHPLLHEAELHRRVLPDNSAWSGSAARVNRGYDFLGTHEIADAAINPVGLWPVNIDIQPALLNERGSLRPLRLRVLLPALCYGHNQRKNRA